MNKETFQKAKKFVVDDVWEIDFNALSFLKRFSFGFVKVCFIVVRGFSRDNCPLHASALTYITLMSMVPLIAMMFSVAKGFGGGDRLQSLIQEQTSQLPENVTAVLNNMMGYVENTNFGVLGAVGVLLLFYTVIAMMGKIESSFNSIWGIQSHRTFFRKFSDYISVLLVVPLLMLAATSINASLSTNSFILFLQDKVPLFADIYEAAAQFTGIVFVWIAFTLVFMFMPNTQVRILSALTGGIVAGTLWQWLQWAYIHLQVGVAKYNAIYGTFASIPIFLAWLYLCWLIVLFGCEVAFAIQNYRTYEEEGASLKTNQSTREALALTMLIDLAQKFERGQGAWSLTQFAYDHHIPIRLSRDIFHQLSDEKLVLIAEGKNSSFMPGLPLEKIKVKDVYAALRGAPKGKASKEIASLNYQAETTLNDLVKQKGDLSHD